MGPQLAGARDRHPATGASITQESIRTRTNREVSVHSSRVARSGTLRWSLAGMADWRGTCRWAINFGCEGTTEIPGAEVRAE